MVLGYRLNSYNVVCHGRLQYSFAPEISDSSYAIQAGRDFKSRM